MANMLKAGEDVIASVMQTHVSDSMTYTRGAYTATIDATTGQTEFVSESESGYAIRFESRDFIFPVADLVLDSSATLPQRGDTITQTINGTAKTFKVFAPSGEQVYRFTGPNQVQIRVHTELVSLP